MGTGRCCARHGRCLNKGFSTLSIGFYSRNLAILHSVCQSGFPASCSHRMTLPAPDPVAAIELEHDAETDTLTARGATGATLFDRFFEHFHDRLAITHGTRGYRRRVRGRAEVVTLEAFSRSRFEC